MTPCMKQTPNAWNKHPDWFLQSAKTCKLSSPCQSQIREEVAGGKAAGRLYIWTFDDEENYEDDDEKCDEDYEANDEQDDDKCDEDDEENDEKDDEKCDEDDEENDKEDDEKCDEDDEAGGKATGSGRLYIWIFLVV